MPSRHSKQRSPRGLHHVEINVSSLEASFRFWKPFLTALGYRKLQTWKGGASYKLGDSYLVFVQASPERVKNGYHRGRVGLSHLAFHASSRRQVDDMTAWVRKSGYAVLYPDRHPHAGGRDHYALYCEDPDRIKVELVAPA